MNQAMRIMDVNVSEKSTDSDGSFPAIELSQMPQQIEVREREDDWTGLNDRKERRKLQNRLNQRLWRKRQRVKKVKPGAEKAPASKAPDSSSSSSSSTTSPIIQMDAAEVEFMEQPSEVGSLADVSRPPFFKSSLCRMNPVEAEKMMARFEALARQNYLLGSPRVDLLLTLIQFNVFRALLTNDVSMGFDMRWLNEDAVSPFNTMTAEDCYNSLPKSLRPTKLQRTVEHHPWIDLFLLPRMRDNLLLASEEYDDTAICLDVVEISDKPKEKAGLIVWGEPWDPSVWEASPTFLKKWAWVVEGCEGLIESTNYWRMKRSEKLITV